MDENRPLYSLTVEEFKELSKTIAIDNSYLIQPSNPEVKEPRDVIFIDEVILLTGYKQSTIHSKVSRKEMPVISYGRPLTFSKEEILNWMKSGKPTVAEMMAEALIRKSKK
jgi:predicted DNA-binding transcriptional regulator AlpA